jgi:isoleucyl-tRNA synthetase
MISLLKDADKHIIKKLKERGRLISQSTINHSYPFCWRSGTPLLYKAIPTWFVRVTSAVDRLIANNAETRWFVLSKMVLHLHV